MFCWPEGGQRFSAIGGLRLVGAHIGGQLIFASATMSNSGGLTLDLEGARIERELFLGFAEPPVDGVSLTAARLSPR